ncbi:MAG: hypothetical protein IPJ39_16805 [Saprospiraceae bacterium]|nr:hypothetical protein [Saprospiraceae bacterium]
MGTRYCDVLKRQFWRNKKVPADGKWHTIRYDISAKGLPDQWYSFGQ